MIDIVKGISAAACETRVFIASDQTLKEPGS